MIQFPIFAGILLALVIGTLLIPPKWDPAIRLKERMWKRGEHPESPKTDDEWLKLNRCPDCHEHGTLLRGPQGGMCTNVACDNCLSEFNIADFGDSRIVLDRMGKLSQGRARIYGIPASQVAESLQASQL